MSERDKNARQHITGKPLTHRQEAAKVNHPDEGAATMKVYEVSIADSPSATAVQVRQIEASSERAAYRAATADLSDGAVVRSVVEVS